MRLKSARKASKLTQQELAEQVGVSQSMICQLESGSERLSESLRQRLESVLRVPIDWNMGGPLTVSEQADMFSAIEIAAQRVGYERALRIFADPDKDPDDIRELTSLVLVTHAQQILLPPSVE